MKPATQSTLSILSIVLSVLTPLGGLCMGFMSGFLLDKPSTAAFMGTYLIIYWTIAILLYIASLIVNIGAWSTKKISWFTFSLSLLAALLCASPLVGVLGFAIVP